MRSLQPVGHCWKRFSQLSRARLFTNKGMLTNPNGDRRQEYKSVYTSCLSTNAFGSFEGTAFPQPAFNRAVEKRLDSNWLSEVFSTSALIIPLLGNKSLIKAGEPVLLPSKSLPTEKFLESASTSKPIFLGIAEASKPVFAVDVSCITSDDTEAALWMKECEWVDLRKYGPNLQIDDVGILAYARGMVEWHNKNKFCSRCGERMDFKEGGHCLQCSSAACASSVYPRLDPAIIALVACGNYILLGRQSRWNEGRYSLLAGFVEVGETFELAVAREVEEESGVKVKSDTTRYIASQPWPFPQSLMVGFIVEAEKVHITCPDLDLADDVVPVGKEGLNVLIDKASLPTIQVDAKELEDARWIHKSFLKAVLQQDGLPPGSVPFSVPGKYAIANHLMRQWISHHCKETKWAGDQIADVEIDEGIFKYVLVRVTDRLANEKLVVRGCSRMAYHADIFNDTKDKLKNLQLQVQVLGGGRMEHGAKERVIHVYGFSQAYGMANHAVTAALLQQWLPLHTISFSWEGY